MRLDSPRLETFRSVVKKRNNNYIANFEGIVFLSIYLGEVQFVIGSCCLVSQSNYLNNFNKDCDCLILACFIEEHIHADATFTRLEIKFWFENSSKFVGKKLIMISFS